MSGTIDGEGPFTVWWFEPLDEEGTLDVPNLDPDTIDGTWQRGSVRYDDFLKATREVSEYLSGNGSWATCKITDAADRIVWMSWPREYDGPISDDIQRVVELLYDNDTEVFGLTSDERNQLFTSLRKIKRNVSP